MAELLLDILFKILHNISSDNETSGRSRNKHARNRAHKGLFLNGKGIIMKEKVFHNQVSWMMFVFSILVIWVHSYNVELFSGGLLSPWWDAADKIQRFVSVGIGQIAVPGFFMLSSYLFFRNFSWGQLGRKWKGRFFSVVIPYFVWNTLYYLGYVIAARLPAVTDMVGKRQVPFNGTEWMAAVFQYRYAPIFWYLYQLILLILLSPVLYLILKNRILGLMYLAVLLVAVHFHLDTQNPNTDALFYYSFAAYGALHGRKTAEAPQTPKRRMTGGVLLFLAAWCFYKMGNPGADVLWTVAYRFLMPVSLWVLADGERWTETKPWMRQSMFLYAIHFVIVRFVNKGSAMILRQSLGEEALAAASLAVYFMLPVIVVAFSYGTALFLGKYMLWLWRILSGGRSLRKGEGI